MHRLNVVELLGLKELEPLHGAVCTGSIGFGVSSLDARVGVFVIGETHWLEISLLGQSFREAR